MRTHSALRRGSKNIFGGWGGRRGQRPESKGQRPKDIFRHTTSVFIHPLAFVCGNVTLKPRSSVWPFVVIRGDTERVEVGEDSNIQDGTIVHADSGFPTIIGDRVG